MPEERESAMAVAVVAVVCAVIAVGLAAAALAVAINNPGTRAPSTHTIAVTEHEYAIDAPPSVPSGSALFKIQNTGNATHQLIALQTDLPEDQLPRNPDGTVDLRPFAVAVTVDGIASGGTETASAVLARGRYVLICNIAGHYGAGMHSTLSVT